MSTAQVLLVSEKAEEMRRRANFAPSIWGDRFIKYDYEKDKIHHARQSQEIQQLKEEVRKELLASVNHYIPKQQLELIDTIERLGLGYHFETEIQQVLQHLYDTYKHDSHQYDLYTAALCFRLLRQHGHFVSCDIFKKFKNDNDNFEESLASDVSGLFSFYEAAHVGVQGEDILDEAIAFTTSHLQSMAVHLANPLAAQVLHALRKPLHKCVPRVEARHYISIYQDEPSHNQALLKLAKLDFNLLQSLHKKELNELSKWMKESIEQIPFVRERMVEGYLWILGMVHQPQYSLARIFLAKLIYILTIVDDLYDAYGTFEELTIFAEAIERWDASCMDQLPEYMQIIYQLLLDFSKEVDGEMAKNGWPQSRVHYAKEVVKIAVRANFDEAKWINDKRVPTMEEYLQASLVTGGAGSLTILLLITTDFGKKEILDWVLSRPTIITTSELHFRLMDDIRSHKFEGERGYAASSVEIYMKQYGISEEEAYKKMHKLLDKAWKDVNEEFLKHAHLPRTVLMFIFNYPRIIHLFYEKGDDYTCVGEEMKAYIESVLVDPVPM